MGLDINLNTSKIDISEEDGLNVDLYNDNIDISDDEADDIIIEITGLKSISKFIGLEDTPLYYDNGKFFKVEDNKIIYTDIQWKDIKGNVDDSPEIVKVISDLVDDITDDIIDEKITLHNHNRDAHPYIQDILQDNYNTLNTKIDEVGDELSQEISHLSDNLNTEIENRETADNTLSETIQNETLARIEADSTLQNNIGTLSDNLNTEINNRTNADNLLREDINEISGNLAQEILNRQTQDGILQGNIDAETLARQNADTVLQNNINTLSQTVTDNNTAINNKVDGINTTLTNSINSLSNTVSSNYTTLDTKIDNTKNALDSDISDLSNTVTNNYNSLDARITTNTGNIATNAGNITTINSKIPNQASSSNQLADKDFVNSSIATNTANFIGTFNSVAELEAYSGTLTNNDYAFVSTTDSAGNTLYDRYKWNGSEWLFEYELNNSSFTAQQWASINSGSTIENINQIASNTQAISTETTNRQDADNNLQSQIDAITASSDVTDIVGTYAQLQSYDTSTLPPNSIIKVLQDEHQNDETTYYRWVITGGIGAWVLIGEEGPYYTKSEADGRFVPQIRTINGKDLSANISLDASDVGALPDSTTIPTVNNGTLDIQVNGTSVGIFTANQSGNTTANIIVPDSATWGNITGNIQNQTDLVNALNNKQDNLTAQDGITLNNNIISGKPLEDAIGDIDELIPVQATVQNQLADKNFVNSSIATNTANFIGTFNSVAELEAYSGTLTNNDYAFVSTTDSAGNTLYDRYKWNGSEWLFEYELNNSSFTAQQWASINSGITSGDVSLISTAIQANDNISELTNDAGYITSASLPTVNNSNITLQKNGVDVGSFTLNQSSNSTINFSIPTDTSDLTNNAGFITASSIPTVDQTYNPNSTNAQSGKAINGAKFIRNTASQSTSLAIKGSAGAGDCVVIGDSASSSYNENLCTVIGSNASSTQWGGTALGFYATVNGQQGISLGSSSTASATKAIQIGGGTNKTANTLQIGFGTSATNYQLLDGTTGLIPDARISSNIARTSQIPSAVTESTVSGWGFTKNTGTVTSVNNIQPVNGNVTISIPTVPTNISAFTNDSGYITSSALNGYATQRWVGEQGYITGISSTDVTTALGYTPYSASNPDGYITSSDLPTNHVTTDTAQSISGQKTFTSTIKSSVNNSLALTRSTGEAFGVTVTRTDANNEIKFGIGQSGDNRGIWDVRNNKWAFNITDNGKAYALGNEIAVKSDLNSLSPLRYSRYSIAQVNSTNKFIKLASMTYTESGNRDFSYLFWVEILEASTAKCYALVRLSARWSNTSYQGHKFEILEKYGDPATSLEALKNLTYAYSLNTTTHKITAEIWLEIKNQSYVSYYLRPTECNEYGDYGTTPVTLNNNIWTYYNKSGNASSIASTAITSGLTQVKVTDATGVRNENDLSQIIKIWTGTKAQYDAIVTKDANTLYWVTDTKIIYLGGNPVGNFKGGRNVGEIISSTLPLTDAGLHLLDGSLLQYGIYKDFIDYIAGLYTSNSSANYFCTETEWQNSVTQYGSCGKFVYDSVNKTVRLPKVSDILQSTTDINALGNLIEAGLPNIKGEFNGGRIYTTNAFNGGVVAPFIKAPSSSYEPSTKSGSATSTGIIGFDASLSNSIYGKSTTVQPQTIKAFVYIVVANSTKTDIQVDIDEIATDLNGKAGTDLANVTDTGKILMSEMGMPSDTYIDLTLGASGSTYTAPANGYFCLNKTKTSQNQYIAINRKSKDSDAFEMGVWSNGNPAATSGLVYTYLPAKKDDLIQIDYSARGAVSYFRFIYAQGSESEFV